MLVDEFQETEILGVGVPVLCIHPCKNEGLESLALEMRCGVSMSLRCDVTVCSQNRMGMPMCRIYASLLMHRLGKVMPAALLRTSTGVGVSTAVFFSCNFCCEVVCANSSSLYIVPRSVGMPTFRASHMLWLSTEQYGVRCKILVCGFDARGSQILAQFHMHRNTTAAPQSQLPVQEQRMKVMTSWTTLLQALLSSRVWCMPTSRHTFRDMLTDEIGDALANLSQSARSQVFYFSTVHPFTGAGGFKPSVHFEEYKTMIDKQGHFLFVNKRDFWSVRCISFVYVRLQMSCDMASECSFTDVV